jgi:hypothetical protein
VSSSAVHSVQFYTHDEALISRLHSIVESSLRSGGSVLIVATKEHRHQLESALRKSGLGLDSLGNSRVQLVDAQEMLDQFMVHDRPDHQRFNECVGRLIGSARAAAQNENRTVTVFGEMVALLWCEGNKTGALELERIWNALLQDHGFHLHCAYPRSILKDSDSPTIKAICDEHSSVLGFASLSSARSALA